MTAVTLLGVDTPFRGALMGDRLVVEGVRSFNAGLLVGDPDRLVVSGCLMVVVVALAVGVGDSLKNGLDIAVELSDIADPRSEFGGDGVNGDVPPFFSFGVEELN